MRLTTFIYALCEPGTRIVRYIGKANNPKKRFGEHLLHSKKNDAHKNCWIRSLLAVGQRPELVILSETPSVTWQAEEMRYIAAAHGLGIRLTNSTDGGDGCHNPSLETRARLSAANKGRIHTPETCEKNRVSHLGKKQSFETIEKRRIASLGRKASAETREKSRVARLGMKLTPEHCENIRLSKLGKKHSEESRAKMSAGKQNISDETRAKLSVAHLGKKPSDETRAKISAALRGKPKSEMHKAALRRAKRKAAAAETGNPS